MPSNRSWLKILSLMVQVRVAFYILFLITMENCFFCARTDTGMGLWISDGTEAGTQLLKADNFGGTDYLYGPVLYKHKVFYLGQDSGERETWLTDGTPAGTSMMADINTKGASRYAHRCIYNGKLYFTAPDDNHGVELWASDGTVAGMYMVKDINSGANSSYTNEYTVCNNKLYFVAVDRTYGEELWVTDGTEAGTHMVKDINPGESPSIPLFLTVYNNKLYFNADDYVYGTELWVTDGTEAGTTIVKDIYPGIAGSQPSSLTVCNNKLLFNAYTASGNELWASDGTEAGTQMIKAINASADPGPPNRFCNYGGKIYFAAGDGNDHEPWVSDGTTGGTRLLKRIYATNIDSLGSNPDNFTVCNGMVYFTARDSVYGRQLWMTDGTDSNTRPVLTGAAPITDALLNTVLLASGGVLYFAANYDKEIGQELYKISPPSFVSLPHAPEITDVTMHPNPATESITVQYTLATGGSPQYRLYDVTGKCVGTWQDEAKSAGAQSKQIGMSNLVPATYQLQITVNGKVQSVSVVKQ